MQHITFELLRAINLERCESRDGFKHPLQSWSVLEWAGAAAGEAGEAANAAKKILRAETGIENKPSDKETLPELREDLAKEIGDVVIYLDLLAAHQGLSLEACVREAFNRTSQERGLSWRL